MVYINHLSADFEASACITLPIRCRKAGFQSLHMLQYCWATTEKRTIQPLDYIEP